MQFMEYDMKTVPIEHEIKIEKPNMNLKMKWNATCKPSMGIHIEGKSLKLVAESVDEPICISFIYSTRT